jgi:hypothetical protein
MRQVNDFVMLKTGLCCRLCLLFLDSTSKLYFTPAVEYMTVGVRDPSLLKPIFKLVMFLAISLL